MTTHRLIQIHTLAEKAYSEAGACRRGACNAAQAGMRGAAIMLTTRASRLHGVWLSAQRRMGVHAFGLN